MLTLVGFQLPRLCQSVAQCLPLNFESLMQRNQHCLTNITKLYCVAFSLSYLIRPLRISYSSVLLQRIKRKSSLTNISLSFIPITRLYFKKAVSGNALRVGDDALCCACCKAILLTQI